MILITVLTSILIAAKGILARDASLLGVTLFPVTQVGNSGNISDHHLTCDTNFKRYVDSSIGSITLYSAQPNAGSHIELGYLCSKRIYYIDCSEGFFGGKDLTHGYETVMPHPGECSDAVREYREGILDTDTYILPSCGWMATSRNTKVSYSVMEHKVLVDPYTVTYVDKIFINGLCKESPCNTVYQGVQWVPAAVNEPKCPEITSEPVKIVFSGYGTFDDLYFHSDYIPGISGKNTCKDFHYCGREGVVLGSGHFVEVGDGTTDRLSRLIQKLPPCPDNTSVVLANPAASKTYALVTFERVYLTDRCREVVNKIKMGLNITHIEMAYLNPLITGIHHGYMKIGNKIKMSTYDYKLVDKYEVDCFSYNKCTIRLRFEGTWKNVSDDVIYCEKKDPFRGCDLPNGLIAYEDSVLNPLLDIDETYYNLLSQKELSPQYAKHPLHEALGHLVIAGEISKPHDPSLSLSSVAYSGFASFCNSVGKVVVYGVIIVGISALLICLIVFSLRIRRRRSPKQELQLKVLTEPQRNNQPGISWA